MAANRTKTIEYTLPSILTDIAESAVFTNSADTTIYIPETTSRSFVSVSMEVVCGDNGAGNVALSAWGLQGSCDSGSNWTTAVIGSGYAATAENISHIFFVDMTDEFTSRFGSGTSGTFMYGIYLDYASAINFTNVSAKLIITYNYDDSAHNTRIKTVRIPIESFNGRLSNTAQIIRQGTITNQIPALDTFLPETSKVYRQITAELWSNTLPSAATATTLYVKLDSGGAETTYGTLGTTLVTPVTLRFFFNLNSMDTSLSHDLYARHAVASQSYFTNIGGWVIVTYEYDHSNSNTIMNSLFMGFGETTCNTRLVGDKDIVSIQRFIEEPGTITLQQSAIWVTAAAGTTNRTFNFGVGSQTVTGYTVTTGGGMAGMLSIFHRVDSGSYRGAGITLDRGLNIFTAQWYASAIDTFSNVSCLMILNYTSGKHASGDGVHSHSVHWNIFSNNRATTAYIPPLSASRQPTIIEPNYYLLGVMPVVYQNGTTGAIQYLVFQCENLSTESNAGGWTDLFSSVGITSNERMFQISNGVCRFAFKRWPLDTDSTRLDIEGARSWRITGLSAQYGVGLWITYHSVTYTIAGSIKNYTGDGSGITVNIHRTDTDELIGSTTTSVGGSYTITWYDNETNVYANAIQNSTHIGRSIDGLAV